MFFDFFKRIFGEKFLNYLNFSQFYTKLYEIFFCTYFYFIYV